MNLLNFIPLRFVKLCSPIWCLTFPRVTFPIEVSVEFTSSFTENWWMLTGQWLTYFHLPERFPVAEIVSWYSKFFWPVLSGYCSVVLIAPINSRHVSMNCSIQTQRNVLLRRALCLYTVRESVTSFLVFCVLFQSNFEEHVCCWKIRESDV